MKKLVYGLIVLNFVTYSYASPNTNEVFKEDQKSFVNFKVWGISVGVGVLGGVVLGALTAPPDEYKSHHAIYWGSILGLITAASVGTFLLSDLDEQFRKYQREQNFIKISENIWIFSIGQ